MPRKYPDERIIAQVEEAMGADPTLSRRAAILQVAGEDALRRIEMKMTAIQHGDQKRRIPVSMDFAVAQLRSGINRFFAGSTEKVVAVADRNPTIGYVNEMIAALGSDPTEFQRRRNRDFAVGLAGYCVGGGAALVCAALFKLLPASVYSQYFARAVAIVFPVSGVVFTVSVVCLFAMVSWSWRYGRRTWDSYFRWASPESQRRYVLTSDALYEFWIDAGELQSIRVPTSQIPSATISGSEARVGQDDNVIVLRALAPEDLHRMLSVDDARAA